LSRKRKRKKHKTEKPQERRSVLRQKLSPRMQRLLPLISMLLIMLIVLVYFAPFFSSEKMMGGSDWMLGEYAKRVWTQDYLRENRSLPMWLPLIFGGCPTFAAFFGDWFALPHLIVNYLLPIRVARVIYFIGYMFLAGLGAYLFLREMKLGLLPATFGAICYLFSGSLMSTPYAGHLARAISIALLPLMMLFVARGVMQRRWYHFVFFASLTALSFLAGHFQMTYYATGLCVFFLIFLLVGERKSLHLKGVLRIAGFFLIGLALLGMFVSVSYLQVYRNLGFGARGETKGYEYTTSWSMPTAELIDLFVPEFSGILEHYWGENFFKLHVEYFGIITLLFVLVGVLFSFGNRNVKFFFFIGIVALMLALGKHTPLFKIAYYLIPGVKKFRAPSLIFFICTLSAVFLAAQGIERIVMGKDENRKHIIIAMAGFIGCLFLFTMIGVLGKDGFAGFITSHFSYLQAPQNASKLRAFEVNYPFFMNGLAKALVVSVICFIFSVLILQKRVKPFLGVGVITLVLLIDLWAMGKRFLVAEEPPSVYYQQDGVVGFLKQDQSLFRVFALQYRRSNDGIFIIHDIQSLGGYHPNPLHRYQEFIGAGETVMFNPYALIEDRRLLDLLNARYLIGIPLPSESLEYQYDANTREMIQQWRQYYSNFTQVKFIPDVNGPGYVVYRNDSCLPRALFVGDYRVFSDREGVLTYLRSDAFDPRQTVLLEKDPGIAHPDTFGGGGTASITEYGANSIKVEVSAEKEGFLLLSENYFPRWNGFIDGKRTEILIADYTLRAVVVPEGKHTVVFKYEDGSYAMGKAFYLIALIVLIVGIVFQFVKKRKGGD
jgi:hypothetical protein